MPCRTRRHGKPLVPAGETLCLGMSNITQVLIVGGTILVVVTGGLLIFFLWRSNYGVWAQERQQRERMAGDRSGVMIDNNFKPVEEREAQQESNRRRNQSGETSEAERARLHQLGLAGGMMYGGLPFVAGSVVTPPPDERQDPFADVRSKESSAQSGAWGNHAGSDSSSSSSDSGSDYGAGGSSNSSSSGD